MISFRDIKFGFASAETESAESPELLVNGYYEFKNATAEAMHGRRFLFLGYKGAGKSAIVEHLRLTAATRHDMFVTPMFLSDFPFTNFKKILSGDSEPESRYPTAWSWILLLQLIDSFLRDESGSFYDQSECNRTIGELRSYGLLPSPSLKELVTASSKRSFKVGLPKLAEATFEANVDTADLERVFKLHD